MALDESKYKTMKIMHCKKCGHVYTASLSGSTECPECDSNDVAHFRPDGREGDDTAVEEKHE
jgi:predicted Zn-ribbon and HTH transcriptional regulator